MQWLDLLRIGVTLAFFAAASVSDIRTRKVRDATWIILGTIALLLLAFDLTSSTISLAALSLLLPMAFLLYDVFWDRDHELRTKTGAIGLILYIVSAVWVAFIIYTVIAGQTTWDSVSAPLVAIVMIVIFEIFYMFDVIKGGADAKAMIVLAMMFAGYPDIISGLPLIQPHTQAIETFFAFSLSVLFVGALFTIFIPLYFLAKNMRAGKKISGRALLGFTMPIDDVEKKFVWLMEWVEGGEIKFSSRKLRDSEKLKEDLTGLKEAGRTEVWVTNKLPFIIPLTIALVFVIVIGNPLFLLY